MTYQVTQLATQAENRQEALRTQEDARREALRRVEAGFARVEALLARPADAPAALARVTAGLERLRKALHAAPPKARRAVRPRPTVRHPRTGPSPRSVTRKKKPSASPRRGARGAAAGAVRPIPSEPSRPSGGPHLTPGRYFHAWQSIPVSGILWRAR